MTFTVANIRRTPDYAAGGVIEFDLDIGIKIRRCRLVRADGRLVFTLPAAVPAGVVSISDNGFRPAVERAAKERLEPICPGVAKSLEMAGI